MEDAMRKSVKNQLLPIELVADEIKMRKVILRNKYQFMSDVALRDLLNMA